MSAGGALGIQESEVLAKSGSTEKTDVPDMSKERARRWSLWAGTRKTSGMSEHNRSLWSEEEVVAQDEGCEFNFPAGQIAHSGTMLHHWSWVGQGL